MERMALATSATAAICFWLTTSLTTGKQVERFLRYVAGASCSVIECFLSMERVIEGMLSQRMNCSIRLFAIISA